VHTCTWRGSTLFGGICGSSTGVEGNLLAAGAAPQLHPETPVAPGVPGVSAQGKDKKQLAPAGTWEILTLHIRKKKISL